MVGCLFLAIQLSWNATKVELRVCAMPRDACNYNVVCMPSTPAVYPMATLMERLAAVLSIGSA